MGEWVGSVGSLQVSQRALRKSRFFDVILFVLLAVVAGLFSRLAFHPFLFGYSHDGGVYAVTAKALATGHGYRIISLPDSPQQTKYPPLYPFLLSLVWRLYPQFPSNLVPMTILSLVCALFFFILAYYYLSRQDYLHPRGVLLIVALTAFNLMTFTLATNLLSDLLYAALSVTALWLVEVSARDRERLGPALAAGAVLGLSFLTRQVGLALLIATLIYLILNRSYRALLRISIVVSLLLAPWLLWSRMEASVTTDSGIAYYETYRHSYLPLLREPSLLLTVISKNVPTLLKTIGSIIFPTTLDLGSRLDYLFVPINLALLGLGFLRLLRGKGRLICLYLFLYLAMIVVSPFGGIERYFVPVLPWLLLMLIEGWRRQWVAIQGLWHGRRRAVTMVMLLCSASLLLISGSGFLIHSKIFLKQLVREVVFADLSEVEVLADAPLYAWVKEHTDPYDVIATYYDPIFYLYTDRRAVRIGDSNAIMLRFYKENGSMPFTDEILASLRATKARYLVVTSSHPTYKSVKILAEKYPQMFVPVYQTADTVGVIYRIDPR